MPDKPTTAAGYKSEQVELVRATCLYVATKLGFIAIVHALGVLVAYNVARRQP